MIVRVRTKDGNFRFDLQPTSDISELLAKILETTTNADPATLTLSDQPRGNETLASTLSGSNLDSLGIKHGTLIFVSYKERSSTSATQPQSSVTPVQPAPGAPTIRPWETVKEDQVDTYWRSQDGKIPRSRDATFCKHGPNGMCDHCMPLEPYDPGYHAEHNIKHLSYNAYLRKLLPKGTAAGTAAASLPPLEPPSYKVKVPCPSGSHAPWPAGICTACQPSTITLQSQPFRMVDHLEIASMDVIDRFLGSWRATGRQRFGWLIGRYAPYEEVPMGVKAVVEAIHEPPQEDELDGLALSLPWEDEPRIRELATHAAEPLAVVGYIFTDLVPTPEDRSKTQYRRHPQSFFLSSLEALFAARVQLANPTPSRASPTGLFASRMVTAVLTGTEDGAIDVSAYQVSEQACAMVEADMVEASVDPAIVRVKEDDRSQDSARYVPDVFFRYKNEYGLEVKKSAKPCFPVEYLIVNVSHGFPQNPSPLFRSSKFSIENRPSLEPQLMDNVMRELVRLQAPDIQPGTQSVDFKRRSELATWLSDWHLIAFLGTTQLVSQEDMKTLLRVATSQNLKEDGALLDEILLCESWQTLTTFAREMAPAQRPSSSAPTASGPTAMDEDIPPELYEQFGRDSGAGAGDSIQICPHCTFENTHGGHDCEVCGLPLS